MIRPGARYPSAAAQERWAQLFQFDFSAFLYKFNSLSPNDSKRTCVFSSVCLFQARDRLHTLGEKAPTLVPVSQVMMCMNCTSDFSLTLRRHHCHGCGRVSRTEITPRIAPWRFLKLCLCCDRLWLYAVGCRLFAGAAPGTDIHWNTWKTAWPKCVTTVTASWRREVRISIDLYTWYSLHRQSRSVKVTPTSLIITSDWSVTATLFNKIFNKLNI